MARRVNRAKAEAFFEALRRGHTRREAAALAGVGRTTAWRWLTESETFRNAADRAESDFAHRLLDRIERAAPRSWRAAAWLLERRFSGEWAQHQTVKVEAADDLTREERAALTLIREYEGLTEEEMLVHWHEMLRLTVLDLTPEGWLDLRRFMDHQVARPHEGRFGPLPWDSLPENVRGPKEPPTLPAL